MANEIDGAAIAPDQSRTGSDPVSFILDRDWAKTSFLLSDSQIEEADTGHQLHLNSPILD
jgi:hypothetical protein